MIDEELYKRLRTTVVDIGKRLEQEHILLGLAVTNLSEIGGNSPEIVEEILETGFSRGDFDTILLVEEEELLRMRKKKAFFFRSYFVPEAFLIVDVVDIDRNSQKIICTIYDSEIPDGIVKEELKKFVHSQKEIKFDIKHKYR